jgi:hypothetical protein
MRTRLDIIFMECKQTIKLRGNTSCKVGQIQLMVQTLPRPNWIPPRVMVLLLYIESQNRDRRRFLGLAYGCNAIAMFLRAFTPLILIQNGGRSGGECLS